MRHVAQIAMLGIVLLAGSSAHADPMRNGKWEITSKTEMSGMPAGVSGRTNKVTICVDNKNKDKPPIGADPSCRISNYKIVGNSSSWKMECSGEMKMSGTGSITFSGDQYSGTSTMNMEIPGEKPITMKNSYTGKRIGDC